MDITVYASVIKDIDEQLSEIDRKYKNYERNHKHSREALTAKLLCEFDSLGFTADETSENELAVLQNSLQLINTHRKTLSELDECNVALRKSRLENLQLKKQVDALHCELSERLSACDAFKQKLAVSALDCEYVAKEKLKVESDLQCLKKASEHKERMWQNGLSRSSRENANLRDAAWKNLGKYKSRDDVITEAISKYKRNEEVYQNTILKLQENNRGLLEEILNLREEIVTRLFGSSEN